MKDLKEVVQNFNVTTTKQFKDNEVVIDEFSKNIINKVFDQLAVIFPAWKYAWPTEKELSSAKMEWTKAFNENGINTLGQVKHGFAKARKSESDFLPSCGKFVSWCNPSPEDLGYPDEQHALMLCVSHRNKEKMNMQTNTRPLIVELCKRVDWWLMNSASNQAEHKKADKHFRSEYLSLISSGYEEPKETNDQRLETSHTVNERMGEEHKKAKLSRGKHHLKNIRENLAKAKLKNIK